MITSIIPKKTLKYLSVFFGGPQGIRTPHPFHAMEVLYQMS